MNQELEAWANEMTSTIRDCIERMETGRLSESDRNSAAVMLVQLAQAIKRDPECQHNPNRTIQAEKLMDAFDALIDNDIGTLETKQNALIQINVFGEIVISEEEHMEMEKARKEPAREDGRTYLGDLLSNRSEEEIKSSGAKYDPALKEWYIDEDYKPSPEKAPDAAKAPDEKEKPGGGNRASASKFKAIYYENSKAKAVYARSKDDAIHAVREAKEQGREKERCYIQEYNAETNEYQQEGIYLIASGKDITPIEIKIPKMSPEHFKETVNELKPLGTKYNPAKKSWYAERSLGRDRIEQIYSCLDRHAIENATEKTPIYLTLPKTPDTGLFKSLIEQLKQDGARYDADKKAWYITSRNDRSKFSQYLPSEKESIHDKLGHNKTALERKSQEDMTPEAKSKHARERE